MTRARQLALALPGASEAPHWHRIAFRTPRKTFATLDEAARDINLMFSQDLRDFFCEREPHVFAPLAGGWGRMGITRCNLDAVEETSLVAALEASHALAVPLPRRRPAPRKAPRTQDPTAEARRRG
ncbi:MmcQ/YjbR family DNA-binding protein [Sabulicella glaciei]|uniref:MmcQ/YjbR family DNA-binding protein n=1 Tax=Sabulicella glaciei TaxID=2984948 RepID=A0ABT3NT80_9PROT|nr:MmcQ/YjbR family DNA-binding protein [Roseococcus sp. MDT2-1-1]